MFVSCIRLRSCQLIVLLVLFAGYGYLAFFAWLDGSHHAKPTEAFGAETNVVENSVNFEPATAQNSTVMPHDLKSFAHEQFYKENKINAYELSGRENVDSLQFNVRDKFDSYVKHFDRSDAALSSTVCDQDCLRFRTVLLNWPQDKSKAAVYYLAKAERLHFLNSSLTSLYHSFLYRFDYPVIVFHEASAREEVLRTSRKHSSIRVFLQEVHFDIPDHINASAVRSNIKCFSYIGYRHMCRFHAKQVYEQAILVGLEYIWRLDDDSLLPGPISYNLFAFMQHHHFQYGYIKIHLDSYDCTTGLWKAVKHYQKLKLLESPYFDKWTEPTIFYNNFEISALSLWTSKQYRDYINYIDRLGGIYYHRWGDAPIKSIAVTLFLQEDDTHLFNDVTYRHGNFFKNASYSSF